MNTQPPTHEVINGGIANCRRCRHPFQSRVLRFEAAGAEMKLTTTVCEPCAALEELERDESRQRHQLAQIRRQNERRDAQWAELCPVQFRTTTEGGNTEIARLERESSKLAELMAYNYQPHGIIARGKTRRCKTRSMWRLMRKMFVEKRSIAALTAARFDRECRDAAGNFTLSKWFDRLASVDVLLIDDLGKAEWTPATEASWFDLVDQRTRENRPIFITTNDDGESLKNRMTVQRGEALIARLRDYCDSIVF